ncbi:hypothetical protein PRIPAC_70950 [Pristionchus pacificus]|uniref:Uncharacterized protein n=1 Tax=Pristionchus pacificus TaxID=54126 RepID=A0A2A6C5K2_PRIPA|nr:hypothetical protein PRIPAC_70950 [Pristionchus pacificus]|eukprot:PDM73301.1 hypothetical protein PRIPAC_40657 [Pristionchus pacificus]
MIFSLQHEHCLNSKYGSPSLHFTHSLASLTGVRSREMKRRRPELRTLVSAMDGLPFPFLITFFSKYGSPSLHFTCSLTGQRGERVCEMKRRRPHPHSLILISPPLPSSPRLPGGKEAGPESPPSLPLPSPHNTYNTPAAKQEEDETSNSLSLPHALLHCIVYLLRLRSNNARDHVKSRESNVVFLVRQSERVRETRRVGGSEKRESMGNGESPTVFRGCRWTAVPAYDMRRSLFISCTLSLFSDSMGSLHFIDSLVSLIL